MAKVFVLEEGTTNLILNPLFKENGEGWTKSLSAGVEYKEDSAIIHASSSTGDKSLQCFISSINNNKTYTFSGFFERLNDSNQTFMISVRWLNSSGVQISDTINSQEYAEKKTNISVTAIAPSNATQALIVFLGRSSTTNQGDVYKLTCPQAENKDYATSFAHGDMGQGFSWAGTPHNSLSIREASNINVIAPAPVSLYYRYSEDGEIWHSVYREFFEEE